MPTPLDGIFDGESLELVLSRLRTGDHLCSIYRTDEQHSTLLRPFMRLGLERDEKVVYIVDAHTAKTVLGYLRDDGVDVERHLSAGQLEVLSTDETYTRNGFFDPDRLIDLLAEKIERTEAAGYAALRVTGEMSWALKGVTGSERLLEYEAKLDGFLPDSLGIALCQYDRRRFKPAVLHQVLTAHPTAVIGTTLYDNFYYTPPGDPLGSDSEEVRFANQLRHLETHRQIELAKLTGRFRALFERSPVAILVYDSNKQLVGANPSCLRLFGVPDIGCMRGFDLFSDPGLPPDALARLRSGGTVSYETTFDFDLVRERGQYNTSGSGRLFLDCTITPIDEWPRLPRGYLVHVKDITDCRRIEEAIEESRLNLELEVQERTRRLEEVNLSLKRSEDRYRALFCNNPIDTVIVDRDGRVTGYNRAKESSGGRLPEIGCLMYKDYASKHEIDMYAELMDCIHNGISKDFPQQRYRDKYLDVRMSPFSEGAIITSIDVTKRTRAEEAIKRSRSELKSLSARLLSAQEEERRRIALELHDGVCQFLAFVKIAVVNAQRQIAPGTPACKCLEEIPSQIREAIEEVRRLVTNLRPSILDNLGLFHTISSLCQGLEETRRGMKVDQKVTISERDVPDSLKIVLFRTFQEALNNVAKHSGADRVEIRLEKKDDRIELCVKDNGCGFDPGKDASVDQPSGRIGLSGMKERIELSGGSFKLMTSHGKGTTIKAFWPISEFQR